MKAKICTFLTLLLTATVIISYDVPKGWVKGGSQPDNYIMGIDPKGGQNGGNAATIKAIYGNIKGFGSLKQIIDADNYKGKRVRLTSYLKTKHVEYAAGMFLRMEGEIIRSDGGKHWREHLVEDDMANRNLKGMTDWTRCEIVLDVPDNAVHIVYGAYLSGSGKVWIDSVKFDVVSKEIPTTSSLSKTPANLDFEQ